MFEGSAKNSSSSCSKDKIPFTSYYQRAPPCPRARLPAPAPVPCPRPPCPRNSNKQTDGQTDGQRDRQTDRQRGTLIIHPNQRIVYSARFSNKSPRVILGVCETIWRVFWGHFERFFEGKTIQRVKEQMPTTIYFFYYFKYL